MKLPHGGGEEGGINFVAMGASLALALGGIALAWALYSRKLYPVAKIYKAFRPVAYVLEKKYFLDDIYGFLFVKGSIVFAKGWRLFDIYVIDGAVNAFGWVTVLWAKISGWFDLGVVDGLVNLTAWITNFFGRTFRRVQTGFVQEYIIVMACGVIAILVAVLVIT